MAYYHTVQDEHARRVREAIAAAPRRLKLRDRLGIVMHSKIDIILHDRKLLGAPFRYTGIPGHPLSFLGKGTADIRQQSIGLFSEVIAAEDLPRDMRESLPIALWALHMGLMLYFLYDDSVGVASTRKLIDHSLDLTDTFLRLARSPLLKPFRSRVLTILREAELMS
ncbi:MAG: hypothetical protein HYX26_08430 [Acidobacteriales bacterium]|nr:hypothetical protein [Terriglobales bacterium]